MLLLVHVTKTIQIYCYKIRTNCENTYQIETFPNHKNQQIHIPRASPFHEGNNLLMPLNCDVVNLKSRESHWENPHGHVVSLWIVVSQPPRCCLLKLPALYVSQLRWHVNKYWQRLIMINILMLSIIQHLYSRMT